MIKNIFNKFSIYRKKSLRQRCRDKYGDDFIKKYDMLNRGNSIGNLDETIAFIKLIREVDKDTLIEGET